MASSSEFWSNGRRKWSLSHEGENGPRGFTVAGDPPETLAGIQSDMEALQRAAGGDGADIDYLFEIPLKVAQSLVGFKHDENPVHPIGCQFSVMTRAATKSDMLGRLLGQ